MRILLLCCAILIVLGGCKRPGGQNNAKGAAKPTNSQDMGEFAADLARCEDFLGSAKKDQSSIDVETADSCKITFNKYSALHPEDPVIKEKLNALNNIIESVLKPEQRNIQKFSTFVQNSINKQKQESPYYVFEKSGDLNQKWLKEGFDILTRDIGLNGENYSDVSTHLQNATKTLLNDRKNVNLSQQELYDISLKSVAEIGKFMTNQPYVHTQEEIKKATKMNLERFGKYINSAIENQRKDANYVLVDYKNIREDWLKQGFRILTDGIPVTTETKEKIEHEMSAALDTVIKELLKDNKTLSAGDRKTILFEAGKQLKNFIAQQPLKQ